jgi:hypothetical protein
MSDEDKDLDNLDLDEDADAADSGSDNSAPPADAKPDDNSEKRINDLMSKAQKAEARAAKAEAALKAAQSGEAPKDKDVADAKPAEGGDEFVQFARENARNTLFGSDPRLADYGLTAESIGGETVAEMRASLAAQRKLIDGIESAARNKILREHGLDPEVSTGAASEGAKDFAAMSNEEFKKFLAERDARPR